MKLYVISICTLVGLCSLSINGWSAPRSLANTQLNAQSNTPSNKQLNYKFKNFREWKAGMINTAEGILKQSTNALSLKQRHAASANDPNLSQKNNAESGLSAHLHELQKQAEKDHYQLIITKELTITDYFVGYLTKQKNISAAINEVSGRLSAEEIAELMAAYANNFFSSKPVKDSGAFRAGSKQ